jgi:hypothetical protein
VEVAVLWCCTASARKDSRRCRVRRVIAVARVSSTATTCLQNTRRLSAAVAHLGFPQWCVCQDRFASIPLWSALAVSNHGSGLFHGPQRRVSYWCQLDLLETWHLKSVKGAGIGAARRPECIAGEVVSHAAPHLAAGARNRHAEALGVNLQPAVDLDARDVLTLTRRSLGLGLRSRHRGGQVAGRKGLRLARVASLRHTLCLNF